MCDDKDAVVLVIDDNEDSLFLLNLILLADGYQVEVASCGKKGIIKTHQLIPDLIILDMMMPDMTGLEVIDSIKAHHHLSQIPILVCTANVYINEDDIVGVEGVCYKPFDIDDMLTRVNSLITCCDWRSQPPSEDRIRDPTLVLDVDHSDPLYLEYQQLTTNFANEHLTLEGLA
ncbi:MAG: response regulator [Cyanobacteria bacterium P01_A01_bin.83]